MYSKERGGVLHIKMYDFQKPSNITLSSSDDLFEVGAYDKDDLFQGDLDQPINIQTSGGSISIIQSKK